MQNIFIAPAMQHGCRAKPLYNTIPFLQIVFIAQGVLLHVYFFSSSKLALQITNKFVYAALVIQWARAPSTNDL